MENNKSSGLIVSTPLEKDFMYGTESSLAGVDVLPSGDWTPYLPQGEEQFGVGFDSMSCTSFSYTNAVETYLNYLILGKKLTTGTMKWLSDEGYIGPDGKVNFSDRFLAIMSGTTQKGNQLNKVAETARTVGLIPNSMLPFGGTTWQEFMNPDVITKEMTDKATEFLTHFKLSYEWVFFNDDLALSNVERSKLQASLKQLPLQVGIPFPASHAIDMVACYDDIVRLFDTYQPFVKDLSSQATNSSGVSIHFAMRHLVEEIVKIPTVTVDMNFSYTFTQKARKGDSGDHIMAIQKALYVLGFFKGSFAPVFGPRTFDALVTYQKSVGLPATGYFGDMTIAKFNERFAPKKNP